MGQVEVLKRRDGYIPSLEGIRGYGFLLVFYGHYFLPFQLADPGTPRYRFLISLSSLALFGVPAFFVLSGYLIGGILYHTRNREGYFRVFYTRRILRVFPVYYLTLLVIAVISMMRGTVPDFRFWIHFTYIQNLLPGYTTHQAGLPTSMIHLWSLAVEEQFYLLWPIVVWLFPERRRLIQIATGLIVCSFALRFVAPLVVTAPRQFVYFTPTRVDAILLGVVLALIRESGIYRRLEHAAKWVVLSGAGTAILLANWKGRGWASTFWGEELLIPITNVVGVAMVIAVMEENSWLQRACSLRWVCWLGGLSYSAYVFHLTFAPFFFAVLPRRLCLYMRPPLAVIASGALALCLTLALSVLCRMCIEGPVMSLKRRIRYGPERSLRVPLQIEEERLLVTTGT